MPVGGEIARQRERREQRCCGLVMAVVVLQAQAGIAWPAWPWGVRGTALVLFHIVPWHTMCALASGACGAQGLPVGDEVGCAGGGRTLQLLLLHGCKLARIGLLRTMSRRHWRFGLVDWCGVCPLWPVLLFPSTALAACWSESTGQGGRWRRWGDACIRCAAGGRCWDDLDGFGWIVRAPCLLLIVPCHVQNGLFHLWHACSAWGLMSSALCMQRAYSLGASNYSWEEGACEWLGTP